MYTYTPREGLFHRQWPAETRNVNFFFGAGKTRGKWGNPHLWPANFPLSANQSTVASPSFHIARVRFHFLDQLLRSDLETQP